MAEQTRAEWEAQAERLFPGLISGKVSIDPDGDKWEESDVAVCGSCGRTLRAWVKEDRQCRVLLKCECWSRGQIVQATAVGLRLRLPVYTEAGEQTMADWMRELATQLTAMATVMDLQAAERAAV